MNEHTKIDIIIPAYKAQDTLPRTLASIAMQTIADQCKVYVCNDADGIGYADIIENFPYISVEELTLPVNGGPGVARQYGIDHSHSPFIAFLDADDTLSNAFALQNLLRGAETDDHNAIICGTFIEEADGNRFLSHSNDTIFMHGKIYRRAFIDKYGVRFNEARANEDYAFNTLCRLVASQEEHILPLQEPVYYWHYKADSITRNNNHEYMYTKAYTGMIDAMTWAIKRAREIAPQNARGCDWWTIKTLGEIYCYYCHIVVNAPHLASASIEHARRYYSGVYAEVAQRVDIGACGRVWAQVLEERTAMMKQLNQPVPLSIYEFIEQIKTDEVKA